MAFETELVAFLLEEELAHDPVPNVTILTFPVFDDGVHVAHRKIFLDEFLVAVQALLSLELPFLCLGRRCQERKSDAAAKQGHSDAHCAMRSVHVRHCYANSKRFFSCDPSREKAPGSPPAQSSSPVTKILVS